MIFSNKLIRYPLNIVFEEPVCLVKEHKHLGLLFTDDLKWSKHIKIIGNKALQKIGLLFRLRAYLSRKQMETIYLNVIRPALEYASIIYDNSAVKDMLFLDNVQRKAALTCTGTLRRTHNSALVKELCWTELGTRRKVTKLVWFFKIKIFQSPQYLYNLILPNLMHFNTSRIVTRSTSLIAIKLVNTKCRTMKYYKSFFPDCIRNWNSMKLETVSNLSLVQFKSYINRVLVPEFVNVVLSKDYIYCSVGRVSKLLTQFRVGLSPLRYSLYNYCITDNPFCEKCGNNLESLEHYFLECQYYSNERTNLFSELTSLTLLFAETLYNYPPSPAEMLCYILNGFKTQRNNDTVCLNSLNVNKLLIRHVSQYIASTGRFV